MVNVNRLIWLYIVGSYWNNIIMIFNLMVIFVIYVKVYKYKLLKKVFWLDKFFIDWLLMKYLYVFLIFKIFILNNEIINKYLW